MAKANTNRAVIVGLDRSGKSVAAYEAAHTLSDAYPQTTIKVVDSSGVYRFQDREMTWSKHGIDRLTPKADHSPLRSIMHLGAFTTARRMAEGWASGYADLVISVRDPFRIDPAVYACVYGPDWMRNREPASRLRLFDAMTLADHPATIVHLNGIDDQPVPETPVGPDFHETPERLQIIADELPMVLEAYTRLYKSPVMEVEALKPSTSDVVASQLEPIVASSLRYDGAQNLSVRYL